MSIFDAFTFKKDFTEALKNASFTAIIEVAKQEIIKQAKQEALTGLEKMNNVVDVVENYIREHIKSDNKIVQWLVNNILIPNVRLITQTIYDLLKEKVKGL